MPLPQRKAQRSKSWDYSNNGIYFVAFCTAEKHKTLGKVCRPSQKSQDGYKAMLTTLDHICEASIEDVLTHFEHISVIDHVVIPNHVHMLIEVKTNNTRQLSSFVGMVKRLSSMMAHRAGCSGQLWQRSFHDHIVRDESDLTRIREYIQENPRKWEEDRYFVP